ncbi:hypothetical protein CK203_005040 [Vitis vinifera]|uniref:Uncharacterized protein n=1 Tax=Vitis vinifera TaxID=29760 RepID=A0A438KED5_VITVI|nr:hypothetical protein CK203_005040 [Vitis vinifera]
MRARGEAGGSRGGRSCFVVEAKSFEILIEEVGGKLRGCIWERSKGVSSWIRFGEASLRCLLDGVEVCCREVNNSAWAIAGRRGIESIEGKGQSFGWNSLAERLRDLGVIPLGGLQGPKGQSVWIEVGEGEVRGRIEQMSQCLVGWWGPSSAPCPEMDQRTENLQGECLVLERWNPEVGCLRKEPMAKEVWVRVIGLPLHLRSSEVFKRIGDECGGFIAADKSSLHEMQWARLLVRCVDREMPSTAHIVVGSGCYSLQLWWESSPWFTQVVPAGCSAGKVAQGKEKRLVEQFVISAWKSKGEGGAVEDAAGRECRVSLWRRSTLCPAVFYEAGDAVEGRVGSADGRGPFKETQEELGCVLRPNVTYGEKGEGFGPVGPVAAEGGDLNGEGISSPRARAQSPAWRKAQEMLTFLSVGKHLRPLVLRLRY